MFLGNLFEATASKVTVVYPGRFQPFHKGHAAVYNHLVQKYGKDNVYIVTSDKTDNAKSPFSFDEKKKMMILTGVDSSKVVFSTQPYRAMEIVSKLDPASVLMFAISEKDMAEDPRFQFAPKKDGSPSYFQPFKDAKECKPLSEHAYMITVPTFEFTVLGKPANSASQIRAQFGNADEETKKKIVADLFGKFDPVVYNIMNNKLQPVPKAVGESTVNEISNDLSKNYMRGALHDTITGKKDRNPGISKAMNRISGTQYPLIPDTENPDPKIRSLAVAVEKMKDQLASLTGQPTTESTMKKVNELSSNTLGKYKKAAAETLPKNMHQAGNRAQGVAKAKDKIKDKEITAKAKAVGHPLVQEADHGGVPWGPVAQKEYFDNWHKWDQAVRYNGGTTEHAGDGTYRATGIDDGGIGQWNEHTGEGWIDLTGESELEESDPGYNKHSMIGRIRRGHEANNKGWGKLGDLLRSDNEADARKALRKGNRYYNMTNPRKGSHTDGGFPKTQVPGLGKVDEASKPNNLGKVYPDTKKGVLEYMQYGYSPSFLKKLDLPTCDIHPDPQVRGVWAVDSMASGYRCIIYLAGYPGPMGDIREHNDNEEGSFTMKSMMQMVRDEKLTPQLMSQWVKYGSLDEADMAKLMKFYKQYNYITDESVVDEGRFVKGPGGVPLDRHGDPIEPKAPKVRAPAPKKLTLDDVWRKVEEVVGNIYPDGDPIDWMIPWFKRQGIEDFKIGDIIDRAARKNGYKDMYDYWKSFGEDTGYNESINEWPEPEQFDMKQKQAKGQGPKKVTEISQDTARSYSQKANASKKDLVNQTWKKGADTDKLNSKIKNRQAGLDRAQSDKRYYKDEQVNELSTDTMKRYMGAANKSREDATKKFAQTGKIDTKTMDKMGNRAERTMKTANKVKAAEPMESKRSLKAIVKEMHEQAAQGNLNKVAECVRALVPFKQKESLKEGIMANVTKALKVAKRNAR